MARQCRKFYPYLIFIVSIALNCLPYLHACVLLSRMKLTMFGKSVQRWTNDVVLIADIGMLLAFGECQILVLTIIHLGEEWKVPLWERLLSFVDNSVHFCCRNMASWRQLLALSFSLLIFEEARLFSSRDLSHNINLSLLVEPQCQLWPNPMEVDHSVGDDLVFRLPFPPCIQILPMLYLHLILTSVENSCFYENTNRKHKLPFIYSHCSIWTNGGRGSGTGLSTTQDGGFPNSS